MFYFSDSLLLAIRLKTIKFTFPVLFWTQILLDTSLKVLWYKDNIKYQQDLNQYEKV